MGDPARQRSVALLVAAALLSSTGGVLLKLMSWPPVAVGGLRGLIAGIFLLALGWGHLRFTFSRLQLATAVAYSATTVTLAVATRLTTAANAILLQYMAPVWIALVGPIFLGVRTTRRDWLFVAGMLLGLTTFFSDGLRAGNLLGILLATASGVSLAGFILLMRKQKESLALEPLILGNFLAFLIGLPATLSLHTRPSAQSILVLLALGVGQLGLGYWLYAKALRRVSALEGALIPMIGPILNPIWVMLAIGERPSGLTLAGGVLVLGMVGLRVLAALASPPEGSAANA